MARILGNKNYDGQTQRKLREARGWSLEGLAYHSGLSYPSIYGYEAGRLFPAEQSHRAIAKALGVKPEALLKAEKPKRGRPARAA